MSILQNEPSGAAAAAGLRGTSRDAVGRLVLGDIIVGIDGDPTETADDLLNALEKHKVGDTVNVDIIRQNKRLRLPVTLQAVR